MTDLVVREYGGGTAPVIVLHGGPGAAGDLAPLARELGKRWRVVEPFQRGSGGRPLDVATHVQDLHDVIRKRCGLGRPVLVGHSWGAMLALAYAAAHPARPAALVLIGCGTFSLAARAEFEARLEARLDEPERCRIAEIERTEKDADRRLAALGRLMTRAYGYEVEDGDAQEPIVDAAAHEQTWADMLRLQRDGTYPAAFSAIHVPVLMIQGRQDPHPGQMIRDDLQPYIPQLEYSELTRCGHSPWLERHARQPFFELLDAWLEATCKAVGGGTHGP